MGEEVTVFFSPIPFEEFIQSKEPWIVLKSHFGLTMPDRLQGLQAYADLGEYCRYGNSSGGFREADPLSRWISISMFPDQCQNRSERDLHIWR